ncbi:MAG: hypothetical protein COA79_10925 [Planctomycetota bacterium]|nr:MAG: hypothetical protein COA79_10925 [Planctomycetota bacterium]
MSDLSLFNESMQGSSLAYHRLLAKGIKHLYHYYLILFQDEVKAKEILLEVTNKSFSSLNHFTSQSSFLIWITEFNTSDEKLLLNNFNAKLELNESLKIEEIKKLLLPPMYAFDLFPNKSKMTSLNEKIDDSINSLVHENNNIKDIEDSLKNSIKDKYSISGVLILILFLCAIVISVVVLFPNSYKSLYSSNYLTIDETKLNTIEMPSTVIFKHIIVDHYSVDSFAEVEVESEIESPELISAEIGNNSEPKKVTNKTEGSEKEIIKKEELLPKEKDQKTALKKIETDEDVKNTLNKKEDIDLTENVEAKPKIENKKIKVAETEKKKDEVLELKDFNNEWIDAILLGDDIGKHKLDDFKNKHVVLFVGLASKDIIKCKAKVISILKKNHYSARIVQSKPSEIRLVATFPGKKNHDKMIKKIARTGSLYGGNDIAEFFNLYKKKEFSKDGRRLIQKFKPEDLPKKVTVVLLIVPKIKKGS